MTPHSPAPSKEGAFIYLIDLTNKVVYAKLSQRNKTTKTKDNKMLLSLSRYGNTYEVYDLDEPNSVPVAYFKKRYQALTFMKKHEKKHLTNIRWY